MDAHNGGVEAQNSSLSGPIDQCWQIINLMRSRIRIRLLIKVEKRIRIKLSESWIRIHIKVMRNRNPENLFLNNFLNLSGHVYISNYSGQSKFLH